MGVVFFSCQLVSYIKKKKKSLFRVGETTMLVPQVYLQSTIGSSCYNWAQLVTQVKKMSWGETTMLVPQVYPQSTIGSPSYNWA